MDVSDLLLLLGSFGGECTREAVVEAPTEPTWFDENADPSALATWGHAVDFCAAVGGELCTYATYCPQGGGNPPIGGVKRGDEWAPFADEPNRWVQVGTWGGDTASTCLGHDEISGGAHGDPAWGEEPAAHGFMGWVLCCPLGELDGTCLSMPDRACDITFLESLEDRSGNNRVATHTGGNAEEIGPTGAHFDGNGDYLTIADFDYESDAVFSVSFWFTKEGCTGGIYEYMYSDHKSVTGTMWDLPYLDIYIGCEVAGGGWSTLGGSVVRYWMRDTTGTEAMIDWPLADAGSFDAITATWVHIILVVSPTSIVTYEDGTRVPESQYGYYGSLAEAANAAAPSPHTLTPSFRSDESGKIFDFGELHIGGRADHNDQRRFLGHIALLLIFHADLTASQASCVFEEGEMLLPHPTGITSGFQNTDEWTTWGAAMDWCAAQEDATELCTLDVYCPDGVGADPFGGARTGDRWAPYLIEGRLNTWVQVGMSGRNDRCQTSVGGWQPPRGSGTMGDVRHHQPGYALRRSNADGCGRADRSCAAGSR